MSVKACDRKHCKSVMCDHMILEHSLYLCNDCFRELVYEYLPDWPKSLRKREVEKRIRDFMATRPGTHCDAMLNEQQIREEFDRLMG